SHLVQLLKNHLDFTPCFIPENFTKLPAPDYSLYNKLDYAALSTTMGCPYNCTYCASRKLSPVFTRKEPGEISELLLNFHQKYNISDFAFYDDALFYHKEEHIEITINHIIETGCKFKFHTPNGLHARFIDKQLAKLIKHAGFSTIRLSLESASSKFLNDSGNKLKLKEFESAIENLVSAGFDTKQLGIYTLMGVPGQTPEEVYQTLNYVNKLGLQCRLSMYSPVPGTPDFVKLALKNPVIKDEPLLHNTAYQYYNGDWFTYSDRKGLREETFKLNNRLLRKEG
ncbi:MAG: B12-binding domain-containing radical SAM protein, partial [Vulcanimicrobiota bacterium]